MGLYRISRNIEASFVDYLKENLQTDWNIERVEKTFAEIKKIELPSVLIRVGDSVHNKVQIGDNATVRDVHVLIDIFATSDGQRLDMKDYIIGKIKSGLDYYEYEIENSQVKNKTQNGRIRILTIDETPINLGTDKQGLDVHDRFRHLIDLTISLGKVEA